MQTANVNQIYNEYVKPLPIQQQQELAEVITKHIASYSNKKRNILELEGLGAELWNSIDAQQYVNTLRNEWEKRP